MAITSTSSRRPLAYALLSLARERNLTIAHRFDEEARRLEALEGGNVFLRDTFRLRREILATALDLWHVKGIVRALAESLYGFLKLLAIVSFLGLIPSVAGGLLGMNVAGNPWPVTLGQVAFGVAMGMATRSTCSP